MGKEKKYGYSDYEKCEAYVGYIEEVCKLKKLFDDLRQLKEKDGLNIYLHPYEEKLSNIQKEVKELENSEERHIPYSRYHIDVKDVIRDVNDEYSQLKILELYAKRFNDSYGLLAKEDKLLENSDELVRLTDVLIDRLSNYYLEYTEKESEVLNKLADAFYNALELEAALDRNVSRVYLMLNHSGRHSFDKVADILRKKISEKLNSFKSQYEVFEMPEINGENNINYDVFRTLAKWERPFLFPKAEEKKDNTKKDLKARYDNLVEEKNYLDRACEERLQIIKYKKDEKNKIYRRKAFYAAIPVVASILVGLLGYALSPEYYLGEAKTYDKKTEEVINEERVNIGNAYYAYKINIKVCGPWSLFEDGKTYVRNVAECEYIDREKVDRQDPEEILKRVEERKVYLESKDVLEEGDSLTEPKIYVTETFANKDDFGKDIPFIVAFLAAGLMIGIMISEGLYRDSHMDESDKAELKEIKRILNNSLIRETVIERYERIGDKFVKLKEEYNKAEDFYGDLGFVIDSRLIETAKKYIKSFK